MKKNKDKVCVFLSPVAAKYLAEVVYSLDYGGEESTTEQDAINHCLEELAMYEEIMEDQITRWMSDDYTEKYKEWLEKNREGMWKH